LRLASDKYVKDKRGRTEIAWFLLAYHVVYGLLPQDFVFPAEVARRYMQSKEFADDTRDFDVSSIVGVESTNLMPSLSSRLT
jgi:hypothetical protein